MSHPLEVKRRPSQLRQWRSPRRGFIEGAKLRARSLPKGHLFSLAFPCPLHLELTFLSPGNLAASNPSVQRTKKRRRGKTNFSLFFFVCNLITVTRTCYHSREARRARRNVTRSRCLGRGCSFEGARRKGNKLGAGWHIKASQEAKHLPVGCSGLVPRCTRAVARTQCSPPLKHAPGSVFFSPGSRLRLVKRFLSSSMNSTWPEYLWEAFARPSAINHP